MQGSRIRRKLNTLTVAAAMLAICLGFLAGCGGTANTGVDVRPQCELPGTEPCVMAVQPAAVRAGEQVMLFGRGFGTDASAVSVRFGAEVVKEQLSSKPLP